jgi:carboxyl-terminal processing protease
VRSGPDPADFLEEPEWTVEPREGGTYTGPVACLIGPGTLGAGELLAMMMKAMPHVVLMGQPTRGACGGPEPLALPIGVTVQYPRRIPLLPDGTVVDGRGVAPDVPVEHEGPGDPTFEAALRDLAARIEGSPAAAE